MDPGAPVFTKAACAEDVVKRRPAHGVEGLAEVKLEPNGWGAPQVAALDKLGGEQEAVAAPSKLNRLKCTNHHFNT